ncbi:LPS export ABC transporter periplasmic protein LptC [Candidatus Fermentibacteria bacterium]|nr:LPS export ABC transporter periplasmic protein LptC [Candidatus Fermentibacteria bacterium]
MSPDAQPRQDLGSFTLVETEGAERSWKLEGETALFYEEDSTTIISGVRLTLFENDSPSSLLTSDSGEAADAGRTIRAWDGVRVESVEGRILETPELLWIESLSVFQTDCTAVLTIPDSAGVSVMTGRGIVIGQDLGASSEVEVRESFTAVYSGEVPVEE